MTFFGITKKRSVLAWSVAASSTFAKNITRCRAEIKRHFGAKATCSHSCPCLVAARCSLQYLPLSWAQMLPPNPATLGFPTACRSSVVLEYRPAASRCSFHSCLVTSTLIESCASSKTSSMTCAPPLHGRGLCACLLFGHCPEVFPTQNICSSSLSAFILSCLCVSTKLPFNPAKSPHASLIHLCLHISAIC